MATIKREEHRLYKKVIHKEILEGKAYKAKRKEKA